MKKQIISFSPKNGKPGCMVGVEWDIQSSAELEALRFFITDYGKPQSDYSYGILGFGADGFPRSTILDFNRSTESIPSGGNVWIQNSLGTAHVLLSPGKYLLVMKWLTPPGDDGVAAQTIGFSEAGGTSCISWMNWRGDDSDWHKDTGPYYGNFMIEPRFSTAPPA